MAIITDAELGVHVNETTTRDNSHLTSSADAACQIVAEWCGRTFDRVETAAASSKVYRPCDQGYVKTDDFWSTTGLIVKTDDNDDGTYETTWTINTDFVLQPDNGQLHGQTWPYHAVVAVSSRFFHTWNRRPSVQVTAAWGWTAVPPAVKRAALIWGGKLYKRKDALEGVLSGFADFGIARVGRGDPDVHTVTGLLAPFVHPSKVAMVG